MKNLDINVHKFIHSSTVLELFIASCTCLSTTVPHRVAHMAVKYCFCQLTVGSHMFDLLILFFAFYITDNTEIDQFYWTCIKEYVVHSF